MKQNYCNCGKKISSDSKYCLSCSQKNRWLGIIKITISVKKEDIEEIAEFAKSRGIKIGDLMVFHTKQGINHEKRVFGEIKPKYENGELDLEG